MNIPSMWCSLYLACLMIVGYGAVARLAGGRSRLETFGLAACAGPGILGLALIALSMLGIKPSRSIIILLTALAAAARLIPHLCPKPSAPVAEEEDRPYRWWTGICLLALAYSTLVVAMGMFVYPTIEWDAFSIWQLKSKLLATETMNPRPEYFTDVSRSYSHLGYPILVPMISAGEHAMTGRLDDELEKTPFFLIYLGMGAAVYAAIRYRRGNLAAITAATLLMCTPRMMVVAGTGTADLPLAAFYACSLVCLLNWQTDRRPADLALTAIFTICMAWTKQEGAPLAIINAVAVAALAPRRPRIWLGFALAVGLAYLPWFLYTRPLPRTDENYLGHLHISELIANLSRLGPVILGFLGSAFDWSDWCVFWFALSATAILEVRRFRQPAVILLWILLLGHLMIYLPPYLIVANWDYRELMGVTQNRLLLHAAPAAALLIGLQWPRLRMAARPPLFS